MVWKVWKKLVIAWFDIIYLEVLRRIRKASLITTGVRNFLLELMRTVISNLLQTLTNVLKHSASIVVQFFLTEFWSSFSVFFLWIMWVNFYLNLKVIPFLKFNCCMLWYWEEFNHKLYRGWVEWHRTEQPRIQVEYAYPTL